MIKKLSDQINLIIKSGTFKQSTLTFSSTLINGFLGMVFYVYLARWLGPSDFGLFTLTVAVMALVADIGNLGINTGIVNFVSKYIKSDYQKSQKFLKLGFYSKIILATVILIFGYLLSPFLSREVFAKPELSTPLKLIFLGVGTTWLFSFTTSYYQASQKFVSWGVVQILTNLLRLIGVVFISNVTVLNLNTAIIFYITAPLVGFIASFVNISFAFVKEKIDKGIKNEFFNYNKWVAIFGGVSAFSSRADTFVLGRLVNANNLGLYSAANQLVQVIPQLIGAIGTVTAPKFSSFDNKSKMLIYFKKLTLLVAGITCVILLSMPLGKFIINSFFGKEYTQSFGIFVILLAAMIIFLLSVPVHNAIIYYYSYPKLFSYLSIINILVVFPSAYYLTLKFGVSATAYAVLIGNTINFVIPMTWFLKRINSKQIANS